ncbi:type I methionyl aminopeptidase [soil metagenome]
MRLRDRGVEIKTPEQTARMRRAGLVVGQTLELVAQQVRPGMTTGELDALAEAYIRDAGAVPSFKGYHGFPGSLCISVNDQVVHGIPGPLVLDDGDLVSVDCGAIVDGWHGDAAMSTVLGDASASSPEVRELLQVTEQALWRGIAAVRPGGKVTDVSAAIEAHVRGADLRFGIVEDYVGHGIGSQMHQPPNVPNTGRAGRGARLVPGLAIAIEPMVTLGSPETTVLADDWTVVSADGSWAAHFEHTVAVTTDGPFVLTALDGGRERLAGLGVRAAVPD